MVTPCHIKDYPADLAAKVTLVSWEENGCELPSPPAVAATPANSRSSTTDSIDSAQGPNDASWETSQTTVCPRQQWAETLLMLCSTAVRLEPELLRSVRYALNVHRLKQGKRPLPASAESLAWQHPAVSQKHSVAATVDPSENKAWQTQLKSLPGKLKRAVFDTQRNWRGGTNGLPDEIWFEEFAGINNCCEAETKSGLLWFAYDFDDAGEFFQYLNQRVLTAESSDLNELSQTRAWLHRIDGRLSVTDSESELYKHIEACLGVISNENGETPSGRVIDPALMAKTQSRQAKKSAWLVQLGDQLAVTKHDPFNIPKNRSSLIARLDYRFPSLKVEGLPFITLPQRLTDALIALPETKGMPFLKTRIQTDLTELLLEPLNRPEWAKRVGRDAYGLFAELEIPNLAKPSTQYSKELVQRFRWIPAGTFMMGSPESEPERYSEDEDYHQVTLTQGYWLADTAVTQAVWQSVMGENPAKFKDDTLNPVEQVSWDDSQQLINQLNQKYGNQLGELVCRLPTEAEWEYACRAGTRSPFSFGDSVTSEQVNFDGSHPYNNGEKSEDRSKTVAVKSLPANSWGLYEMHGNVWEWCEDVWQENLGSLPMVDPCHSYDKRAYRVRRSGSWALSGGSVRSACRGSDSPNFLDFDIGLRLSLGHVFEKVGGKQSDIKESSIDEEISYWAKALGITYEEMELLSELEREVDEHYAYTLVTFSGFNSEEQPYLREILDKVGVDRNLSVRLGLPLVDEPDYDDEAWWDETPLWEQAARDSLQGLLDDAVIYATKRVVLFKFEEGGMVKEIEIKNEADLFPFLSELVDIECAANAPRNDGEFTVDWDSDEIVESVLLGHPTQLLSFFADKNV